MPPCFKIPRAKNNKGKKSSPKPQVVDKLLKIMATLRGPSGCPWDRQQTEKTLKRFLLEEAYEVLEAIEANDPGELKKELGDLLLQIIFLSRIAEEKGQFNFSDVAQTLTAKLIRRHPHVFLSGQELPGRNLPKDAESVKKIWQAIKEREGENSGPNSLLGGLPLSLPALERAQRLSAKVSRVGFDWPNSEAVWQKVTEELNELKKARKGANPRRVEEELGDLLFTLVNWARFQGLSAEEALRKANQRFVKRFRQVEIALRQRGRTPEQATLKEMDEIWNRIKKRKGS